MVVKTIISPRKSYKDGDSFPYSLSLEILERGDYPSRDILGNDGEIVDWGNGKSWSMMKCRSFEEAKERRKEFLRKLAEFLRKWDNCFQEKEEEVLYKWVGFWEETEEIEE